MQRETGRPRNTELLVEVTQNLLHARLIYPHIVPSSAPGRVLLQ